MESWNLIFSPLVLRVPPGISTSGGGRGGFLNICPQSLKVLGVSMVWEGALCFGKGQQSMKGALGGVKHGEGDACGASYYKWHYWGACHVGNAWRSMVCVDGAISTKTTRIIYTPTVLSLL